MEILKLIRFKHRLTLITIIGQPLTINSHYRAKRVGNDSALLSPSKQYQALKFCLVCQTLFCPIQTLQKAFLGFTFTAFSLDIAVIDRQACSRCRTVTLLSYSKNATELSSVCRHLSTCLYSISTALQYISILFAFFSQEFGKFTGILLYESLTLHECKQNSRKEQP